MKTISVRVHKDHLERLAKVKKPILALEELMWNALDADAPEVNVKFRWNALGGLDTVTVRDEGHGISYEDAFPAFEGLGGSWKKVASRSKTKSRLLHGKAGKGRFRAFAIGRHVQWTTRFSEGGIVQEYRILGDRSDLGTFSIEDKRESEVPATGTEVIISGIDANFPSLTSPQAIQEITEHFALYMREYPDVRIMYNSQRIDPSTVEDAVAEYALGPFNLDDRTIDANLTVIEWKTYTERALVLCDDRGFAFQRIPPGIQATGYNFTAYLKSEFLRDLDDENSLVLEELHPDLRVLIDAAKDKLRDHFRTRAAESAVDLVTEWKMEDVYPYSGEPTTILEMTERQVFDICALNVNTYLPDFDKTDNKNKKLQLRLLKQTLEESPQAVLRIMQDVLDLPKDKQDELVELLSKTTLAAIVTAAKTVTNRLDFLRGLEILVFDHESKGKLLERSQLHKILADHTWIFGEEFNLTVSDQSLTEVLRKHLALLGRDPSGEQVVRREDGSIGIVDLMLSRLVPQPRAEEREHLVVELKRPAQSIDLEVAGQVEGYAFAVAGDERFRDTNTRWTFWAVSNEVSESVKRKGKQANRPEGIIYQDDMGQITIWVKTWGQIIDSSRARLRVFEQHLQYSADNDSALAYLRKTHDRYLPQSLLNERLEGAP